MVKRRVCHVPKFSAWVTEKEIEWVGFWTRLSFTSSGKWSKGFYPNDVDSRVHNSWLSLHVAQVTWLIYGNCFVSKLILLANPILQSVRTIWLWCCALLSTYALNLKLVLQWQERPLPARLPSLPRPPFSCTRSALTFPTSYSVFFFLFFLYSPRHSF